eukprot:12417426-Karenia_brevis.AAC.1
MEDDVDCDSDASLAEEKFLEKSKQMDQDYAEICQGEMSAILEKYRLTAEDAKEEEAKIAARQKKRHKKALSRKRPPQIFYMPRMQNTTCSGWLHAPRRVIPWEHAIDGIF